MGRHRPCISLADTVGYTIGALRGLRAETSGRESDLERQIRERDLRITNLERRLSDLESRLAK